VKGSTRARREVAAAAQQPVADTASDGAGPVPVPVPAKGATPPRTVAGSTWVLACIAVLILIVLIVFVAQNTASVRISFFALHGRFPLAVALLAAVAAGCVLTMGLGTTRILQLRRIVRRRRREDLAAAERARVEQERAENERLENERAEQERAAEAERAEQDRAGNAQPENEQSENERSEEATRPTGPALGEHGSPLVSEQRSSEENAR
jgi:uncharacterized integral membrane protein